MKSTDSKLFSFSDEMTFKRSYVISYLSSRDCMHPPIDLAVRSASLAWDTLVDEGYVEVHNISPTLKGVILRLANEEPGSFTKDDLIGKIRGVAFSKPSAASIVSMLAAEFKWEVIEKGRGGRPSVYRVKQSI